jgi:hypothetical protein
MVPLGIMAACCDCRPDRGVHLRQASTSRRSMIRPQVARVVPWPRSCRDAWASRQYIG